MAKKTLSPQTFLWQFTMNCQISVQMVKYQVYDRTDTLHKTNVTWDIYDMKKWTSHHLLRDTILCLETFTSLQNTEYMCMVTGTSLCPFVLIRSNAQVLRDLLRRYQWGSDEPWISTGRCKLHSNNVKLVLHCCTSLYNSWKRSELVSVYFEF